MSKKRLGIPMIGGKKWMGGISYTELLLKALQTIPPERWPECLIIMNADTREEWPLYKHLTPFFSRCVFRIFPGITDEQKKEIACEVGLPIDFVEEAELFEHVDVYFPAIFASIPGGKAISWIPDFQHCFWPEFFSPEERRDRNNNTLAVLDHAAMLVFSSQAVKADFHQFFPEADIPTAVLPFYSLPENEWYLGDPAVTAMQYGLPERFFICCNQFWLHKNHKIIGDALALIQQQHGVKIPLVCTGSTTEYRAQEYTELLRQYWISQGIENQIFVLGMIPREDQVQLIRRSLAVVQPSLFEGWSTVVEDARVLGKKIFLSSLPVHQEQQPSGAVYFDPWNAEELAQLLYDGWQQLPTGPDQAAESQAREAIPALVHGFAEKFLTVMDTAVTLPSRIDGESRALSAPLTENHDIPSQLKEWGRDLLERFGLLGQLLAGKIPSTLPISIWKGGIGPLPLALQSLGNPVIVVGYQPVEKQFLQLLTQNTVSFLASLPEQAEMVVLNDATVGWDEVVNLHPRRIVLTCSVEDSALWQQRLSKAGYENQIEQTSGDWIALAGAKKPWMTNSLVSPRLIAEKQAIQAYRVQKDECNKLSVALEESEADRAARLEIMHRLEGWLHESEAHRAAQGELIEREIPRLEQEKAVLGQELARLNSHLIVRVAKKLGLISRESNK